jgi:hypothetical protein
MFGHGEKITRNHLLSEIIEVYLKKTWHYCQGLLMRMVLRITPELNAIGNPSLKFTEASLLPCLKIRQLRHGYDHSISKYAYSLISQIRFRQLSVLQIRQQLFLQNSCVLCSYEIFFMFPKLVTWFDSCLQFTDFNTSERHLASVVLQ